MWSHTDAAFSDEEEMVDMELYAPYVPQAMALLAWCACMALVAAGRIGGWRSVWMMLAGAGAMAVACLAANDRMAALSCVCVGLCVQAIPLLALVCLTGEARTCATMLADGTQVALTMTMVAETTYNGAYVCMGVVRLAATLAGLALLAIMLRSHLGRVLLGGGGMRTLAVAGVAVVLIALRSPNCSVVVDLPGWGFASLTEAAVACYMVALSSCCGLYAPPGDGGGLLSRISLPAAMLAVSCCMSYLGDAAAGTAFAVTMALVAHARGRSTPSVAASLAIAIAAATCLSLVVPNMANSWRVWSGTMDGPFADTSQARTVEALFSGDSHLLGCGVGRSSHAMWDAPQGVAWPLMMSVGTFGALGLAALAMVVACSLVTGVRAIRADGCGMATPFLAVSMAIALGFGLLAICGVLPDLGTHSPMFLSVDTTTCVPIFTAVAMALALGLDAAVSHSSPHDDEMNPLMQDTNEE